MPGLSDPTDRSAPGCPVLPTSWPLLNLMPVPHSSRHRAAKHRFCLAQPLRSLRSSRWLLCAAPSWHTSAFRLGGLIFWGHRFVFSIVHRVLKVRILEWVAIPSSSGPCSVRTLHSDLPSWGALHGKTHGLTELHKPLCHDKAVISEGEHLLPTY